MNASNVRTAPLALGALVGLGIVFMIDPHHGEARRDKMKRGCRDLSVKCMKSRLGQLMSFMLDWRKQAARTVSSFEAEIRARAPAYLQ